MQWFLTLFTSLPCWDSVLAIWDLFLLHGMVVVFRAGLSLFQLLESRLMSMTEEAAVLPVLLRVPVDVSQYHVLIPALWRTEVQEWEINCMNSIILEETDEGHDTGQCRDRKMSGRETGRDRETTPGRNRTRIPGSTARRPTHPSHDAPKLNIFLTCRFNAVSAALLASFSEETGNTSPVSPSSSEEQRDHEETKEPSGKEAVGSGGKNVFARMLRAVQRYLADTTKQSTAKAKASPGNSSPAAVCLPKKRVSASISLIQRRKSQSKRSQNASVARKGAFTLQDAGRGATEDSSAMTLRRLCSGPVGRVARRRSGVPSTRVRSLLHRTHSGTAQGLASPIPNSSCSKPGQNEAWVEHRESPDRNPLQSPQQTRA
ncbi:uncharacterized protein si:ch211-266k8.4 isoform X2 [Neoarius graeffei]|uniref:uncharacterized protein si:ch211-266k8.4 isoform X2 n=1 Tax=Neoarius graeffei TaxID=443677 RepID=UPI00298C4C2B|nr:uncharacterized protein si:ch211-266k8.4 isoform X2 [Neoarius graeffei]XP_060783059.1 uncharacterized protein si:ch211-266k8.4 isoform X2 [Neoarius graeffei]